MNRLFIIGNGFDRAHNLPTSYHNFVNYFWQNIKENYSKEEFKKFVYINELYAGFLNYSPIKNFMDFRKNLMDYSVEYKYRYNRESDSLVINPPTYVFKFENDFFRLINIKNSIENWVDIENEYYKKLKTIVKSISMDFETKKKSRC